MALPCGDALSGLVPKIGAGFLARKREARPSPENLPPGEGRRGARARLSVGAKGRGITRRRSPTAGEGPSSGTPLRPVKRTALRGGTGGSLLPFLAVTAAFGLSEPRTAPQRSSPEWADRRGPGRAWDKGRGAARDETRPGLLNQRGQGRDVPGAGRPPAGA